MSLEPAQQISIEPSCRAEFGPADGFVKLRPGSIRVYRDGDVLVFTPARIDPLGGVNGVAIPNATRIIFAR